MRTVIFVASLLGLALVSGASFVVKAQDADPSATLEYDCSPTPIPSGIDTLVSCTFTAHNTGSAALRDVRLTFQPGAGSLPDAYYFFGATLDARPLSINETQTDYELGDLAPDARAKLVIDVIVRASHSYVAEAVLTADPDMTELARVTVAGTPGGNATALSVKLAPAVGGYDGEPRILFLLTIENHGRTPIRQATGEAAYASDLEMPPTGEGTGYTEWRIDRPGHAVYAAQYEGGGEISPGGQRIENLPFRPRNTGPCTFVHPAVVVTAEVWPGVAATSVAIAAAGTWTGECPGGAAATGFVSGLPSGGDGAMSGGGGGIRAMLFILAFGGLLVAAGLSVRRARRR
jgi:hypothetical protein